MPIMLSLFFLSTLSLFCSAFAAPYYQELHRKDALVVVRPKITSPTADTIWVAGTQYDVTWETSDFPPVANITNLQGKVVLGQFVGDGMHLFLDSPLAQDFPITDGRVKIIAPDVTDGNYMIVLFGDSGNTSPEFKIQHSSASPSTPASSGSLSIQTSPPTPVTSASLSAMHTLGSTTASETPAEPTSTGSSSDATHGVSSTLASVSSQPTPLLSSSISPSQSSPSTNPTGGSSSNGAASWRDAKMSWFTIAIAFGPMLAF